MTLIVPVWATAGRIRMLSGPDRSPISPRPRDKDAGMRQLLGFLLDAVQKAASESQDVKREAELREIERELRGVAARLKALSEPTDPSG